MKYKRTYQKIDLGNLISGICKRPKLYVGNGDFRAACAYINGFADANEETLDEIQEFNHWLSEILKLPPNWVWVGMIEKRYPENEDALRKLSELFEKFRKTRKKLDNEILY